MRSRRAGGSRDATPSAVHAEPASERRLLELPDLRGRASAFRAALRELATKRSTPENSYGGDALLTLTTRNEVRPGFYVDDLDGPVALPGTRDLVFEEEFLFASREDEHVSAARHWLGRRLKGSDRRTTTRSRRSFKTRLAWDHGPIAGVGVGPLSVRAGEDHWRLQYKTYLQASGGPWTSRLRVGETDGELVAEFLIGRSLLAARTR